MEARGFFQSLFDYSFSSFITARLIKVLYILSTILVGIYTLALVVILFNASSIAGVFGLIVVAPLFFVLAMIYVRVFLELLIVIFRIHEDVRAINERGGGGDSALAATPPGAFLPPSAIPEPEPGPAPEG
jgi:hypothetical protein